jgi:hypothetical protein
MVNWIEFLKKDQTWYLHKSYSNSNVELICQVYLKDEPVLCSIWHVRKLIMVLRMILCIYFMIDIFDCVNGCWYVTGGRNCPLFTS